ncbi:MAG: hypothetical protein JXR07_05300 [Reichenbachiella sp.]
MKNYILIALFISLSLDAISQEMTSTFFDPRDGQEYETVFIEVTLETEMTEMQEWMAVNLNYASEDSYCYNNYQEYCNAFGRLYSWKGALKACPAGWHLSTYYEWELLMAKYGGPSSTGPALKEGGESGLNLKPAGFSEPSGAFIDIGVDGYYWKRETMTSNNPGTITIHSGVNYITNDQVNAEHRNSQRCVRDR